MLVLLRGIQKYLLDTLHLLAGGDIYELSYKHIKTIFRNHSRVARNNITGGHPIASTYSSKSSIKGEIRRMLEDFKSELLQTLGMQVDTLHIKRKKVKVETTLAIFCPRCTKRHHKNCRPLSSIEVCSVCEEKNSIDKCPSLIGLLPRKVSIQNY